MNAALFRSGRHTSVAVRALRDEWPGCRLLVVSQPGTEALLEQLGIPPEDRIIYSEKKFFTPLGLAFSPAGAALRQRGYEKVAVLWTDPEGKDHGNVNRTALLLSPRGFTAVTPDGSVSHQQTAAIIAREARRALCSAWVFVCLQIFLFLPAAFLRLFARR